MTQPNSPDKKPAPKKAPPSKGFKIPKLTETQWGIGAGVIFFVGYALYLVATSGAPSNGMSGMNAPLPSAQTETAEQKFKRENKNHGLPDGKTITPAEIKEKTQLTQQVPFGDKELEFRIRLPRNWVMSEFARYGTQGKENYAVLTNIARYFGPAIEDARPYVWVEVEHLPKYITAETWARSYMIKRGFSPEALEIDSDTRVEALYVEIRDLQSYAVHSAFQIEGDKMLLVEYGVPIHSYDDYKDMMGLTLNSFKLVRPIDRKIEEIKDYRLLNVIKFKHYASWQVKNEYTESTLKPSVELQNPQNIKLDSSSINTSKMHSLQGLILVNAWRQSTLYSPEKNMEEINKRLQELSIVLKSPTEDALTLPPREGFTKISQTQYLAQVDLNQNKAASSTEQFGIVRSEESKTLQEVWITTLDNGYYLSYLTMISPLKATNYVVWAQNMAAYKLLINSIELRGPPKSDD
jgi:hypothetical protein